MRERKGEANPEGSSPLSSRSASDTAARYPSAPHLTSPQPLALSGLHKPRQRELMGAFKRIFKGFKRFLGFNPPPTPPTTPPTPELGGVRGSSFFILGLGVPWILRWILRVIPQGILRGIPPGVPGSMLTQNNKMKQFPLSSLGFYLG